MLGRDAIGYALSKIAPGLTSVVSVVVFTRLLGQGGYGMYALLFSLSAAMASLCGGWLCQGVLRYYSDPRIPQTAMNSAIKAGTAASVLCCAIIVLLLRAVNMTADLKAAPAVLLAVLLAALILHYSVRLAVLQAAMRPGRVALNETVRAIASFVAGALLVLVSDSGYLALTFGLCVGYAVATFRSSPVPNQTTAAQAEPVTATVALRRMIRFGFPLSLWLGGMLLLPFVDRLLVSHYLGFSQTGMYAASYDLIVRGYSICMLPITLAVHPRAMAKFNEGSRGHALSLVWTGMRWQLLVFCVSFAVVAAVGPIALQYALGLDSAVPLSLVLPLTAGGFLWQLALLVHKPLELANRTHWMFGCLLVAIGASVSFNIAMLPRMGLAAAGYATLISSLIYVVLCMCAYAYLKSRSDTFQDGVRSAAGGG